MEILVIKYSSSMLFFYVGREEADEFCRTLEENEDESRTLSEMADVLYHELVLLIRRGLKFEDVLEVLRCRFAQSGIDEKNSRKPKTVNK